ncbi:epoxide hydrolase 1-like protein, partial [Leptotrombidium deliense]
VPVNIPVGVSVPPNEIVYSPKIVAKQMAKNILHYNFLPRAGHFAAFEEPHLIAGEIRTFVTKCIDYHNQIEMQKKKETENSGSQKK